MYGRRSRHNCAHPIPVYGRRSRHNCARIPILVRLYGVLPYTSSSSGLLRTPHPCTVFAVHLILVRSSLYTSSSYGLRCTPHPCTVFAVHSLQVTIKTNLLAELKHQALNYTLQNCAVFTEHLILVRSLPYTTPVYSTIFVLHPTLVRTVFSPVTMPLYGLRRTGGACGRRPGRGTGGRSRGRHEPDGSQPRHDRGVLLHPVHHY